MGSWLIKTSEDDLGEQKNHVQNAKYLGSMTIKKVNQNFLGVSSNYILEAFALHIIFRQKTWTFEQKKSF